MKITKFFISNLVGTDKLTDEELDKAFQKYQEEFVDRLMQASLDQMDDEKYAQFVKLQETKNDQEVAIWIKDNTPNYEELGDKVLANLQKDLLTKHKEILGV